MNNQEHAKRLRAILNDDVFTGAINQERQRLFNEWSKTPPNDTEGREHLYLMGQMLSRLLSSLNGQAQRLEKAERLNHEPI